MIQKITLQNFKRFELQTIELKDKNFLEGANGVGKTSILEAIVFCLYGRLLDGSDDIKRLIKNGSDKATVTIQHATIGKVSRSVTLKSSPKITIDGKTTKQEDLISMFKLPSLQYFLSATNPDYWLNMDNKNRRSLILDLTPSVNAQTIFNDVFIGKKWIDKELTEENIKELNTYFDVMDYQESGQQIKNLQSSIDLNRGRLIELNSRVYPEVKPMDYERWNILEELRRRNEDYKQTKLNFETQLSTITSTLSTLEGAENKISELKEQLVKLISEFPLIVKFGLQKSLEIAMKKPEFQSKLMTAQRHLEETEEKLSNFNNVKNTGICPTCGSKFTGDHIEKEYVSLVENIKDLKTQIENYKRNVQGCTDLETQYRNYESRKSQIESQINFLEKSLDSNKDNFSKKENLQLALDTLVKPEWSEELEKEYSELLDTKHLYEIDGERVEKEKAENEKDIKETESTILKDENRLKLMLLMREALSPKGVQAEMVLNQTKAFIDVLKTYNKEIDVQTLEPLKSDPERFTEVFNVYLGDKVESKLSTGEKMQLACQVSFAIQDLLETKYQFKVSSLFVDNASLITYPEKIIEMKPDLQYIFVINNEKAQLDIR